ncbi:MAG: dihydrofolate reductase [Parcubacteria group bacterium]|nr:dihydrofolate reductase [Parcubacteria group bacterium]
MSKLRVMIIMALSADGYITNHEDALVDWTSKEDKKHFVAVTKAAGVLIYGRKTFEMHNKALPGRLNVIMTRTPDLAKNVPGQLEFTNQPPAALLSNLAERGFTSVIVAGGSDINTLFLKAGLVDELYLTIEPIMFGAGKRLFADLHKIIPLELIESTQLNFHTVLLHYRILH